MSLTPEQAAQAIRDGRTVKMTVGTGAEDPVLLVKREMDTVMSDAIAGWSAGVREPVCAIDSTFLNEYLSNRAALELEESIHDLFQRVREHPDFVFGTIFVLDDFPHREVPDDFSPKHTTDRMIERANEEIAEHVASGDYDEQREEAGA